MLTDKICLITGAAGGLGKTVCHRFCEAGASVIAVDGLKVPEPKDMPDNYHFHRADVLDDVDIQNLFKSVSEKFKRLDVLINLVGGIYPWSELTAVDVKTWDFTIQLNLKSAFLCSREALKIMAEQKSGKIVNIGAGAGLKGGSQAGPYGAAKAAVINLTETMAEENKANGIQVNAIIPSIIDTPANRKSMHGADFSKWVTADEITNVLMFLASEESSGVTGSIIRVPGRV